MDKAAAARTVRRRACPRLARPPNRPSLVGSQPTRVSQRARLLLQAGAYPGVSTASWSGVAGCDATPHPAFFFPLPPTARLNIRTQSNRRCRPRRPMHLRASVDSAFACVTWPHRLSVATHTRRIPSSPISGRHGHARSKTRSANAGGEAAGSFQGFCGAAWPCRPPASPMRRAYFGPDLI